MKINPIRNIIKTVYKTSGTNNKMCRLQKVLFGLNLYSKLFQNQIIRGQKSKVFLLSYNKRRKSYNLISIYSNNKNFIFHTIYSFILSANIKTPRFFDSV